MNLIMIVADGYGNNYQESFNLNTFINVIFFMNCLISHQLIKKASYHLKKNLSMSQYLLCVRDKVKKVNALVGQEGFDLKSITLLWDQ